MVFIRHTAFMWHIAFIWHTALLLIWQTCRITVIFLPGCYLQDFKYMHHTCVSAGYPVYPDIRRIRTVIRISEGLSGYPQKKTAGYPDIDFIMDIVTRLTGYPGPSTTPIKEIYR